MEFHEIPRDSMGFHRIPRDSTGFHGFPQDSMESSGTMFSLRNINGFGDLQAPLGDIGIPKTMFALRNINGSEGPAIQICMEFRKNVISPPTPLQPIVFPKEHQ